MAEERPPPTTTTPLSTIYFTQNTKVRNLLLIASWKNAFVYLLAPILSGLCFPLSMWIYFAYTQHLVDDKTKMLYLHLFAAGAAMLVPVIIATLTAEDIREKLSEAGYVQRPTTSAQLDLGLNVVLALVFFWTLVRNTDHDDVSSLFMKYYYLPTLYATMWLLVYLWSLGPIIWFTVRAR